ncbi:biopolymer transporter ExbD [Aliidongia dinghuensis]|uniref:Biopolymer transporter ExbD n=1 Tax=Aliidongia dinghuensis TaxID=1867774 RepID=A0A8J2YRJ6_9PROT|nr:biopolymer transporter ExbD [Aliidongia dinghuensis]GGF08094.1 biopolymer transporter ExbD [Aliidongia dinghuensis]
MGMNVGSGGEGAEPEVMVDMNTTPLIDVMLVLLIMLIITIPIQTHATKLDLPAGNPPPPPTPPEVVTVDVDFDGTILWNDQVVDRQGLDARIVTAAAQPVQPELHLRPNKLVTYKYVAAVMADAQRLGLTKLSLVGNEQFVDN